MKMSILYCRQGILGLLSAGTLFIGAGAAYAQPTTLAAVPTVPAGHVVSLYNSSATYSDISGVNFYEVWWSGQWTSYGDYPIPSTTAVVKGYQGLLFTGVGFEANPQDVSGCTNLHLSLYTPNGDSFAVRVVDTTGHSADITYTAVSGVITSNSWLNLNLPLSQFMAAQPLLNLHSIQQLGWIINNPGEDSPADYYIDNVYFGAGTNLVYTPPPAIPAPTNNAPTPTLAADKVLAMYNSSGTYSDHSGINWDASWSGSAESSYLITNTGNTVMYLPALAYVGVEFYSPNQIDTTGFNTLHVDVWTADANQLGIQLVSISPATEAPQVNISKIATNQWVGIDIPLSYFSATNALVNLTALQQLLWIDNASAGSGIQNGDFYVDNIYFYSNSVAASPTIAASVSAHTFSLSFATQTGFNYTVQYKTNLTDSVWQTLSTVPGNGAAQVVTDPTASACRFYRLSVQ